MTLSLPAPAKINLFLHIIGRREDGYHELQTLFQFLDWGDALTFNTTDHSAIEIACDNASLAGQQNLIYRAAYAIQNYTHNAKGVTISLKKNIPIGAGLGGGSSDAATTLLALNYLWQLDLSLSELTQIGKQLGADVPIFIKGQASFGEGIGDRLTACSPPEHWYLIVIPPVSIETIELYRDPNLPRKTPKMDWNHFDLEQTHNDFEVLACKRYPIIAEGLAWLKQYAPARLTGSGSCFFGTFFEKNQAERILHLLPKPFHGLIAKGCNRSPLHLALDQLG